MKYFIDTEFIEGFHKPFLGKKRHFIDLISIGIVGEDGRTYYAISNEFNPKDADAWVMENVITPMYEQENSKILRYVPGLSRGNFHKCVGKSNKQIAKEIVEFTNPGKFLHNNAEPYLEFYGYFSDYDWVLLCSLFGRMIDLPNTYPMFCNDLKQKLNEKVSALNNNDFFTHFHVDAPLNFKEKLDLVKQNTKYPVETNAHNALDDAKWNFELYKFLQTI